MTFSIITVVYNNVKFIEDCIKSVISQSYPEIEYIIIDGDSNDGTLDVIERYRNRISTIVSEKDNGPYDAMNKGLKLARGDIISFLHSDDIYANNGIVSHIAGIFKTHNVESIYGDLVYVNKNNLDKIIRCWKSGGYSIKKIKMGWMLPHPAFFAKKTIYERCGYFNSSFKIAADYEFTLKLLYKHKVPVFYSPEILVKMRWGGVSNKNIVVKTVEDYKACRIYGLGVSTVIMKNIRKMPQFFIR